MNLEQELEFAQSIKWVPHKAQVEVILALFHQNKKSLFIECARKLGKALALDTPIPTPNGWTTMGELKSGDFVFDETGKPTKVLYAHDYLENQKCFEVIFGDNTTLVACENHRWMTLTKSVRRSRTRSKIPKSPSVVTTKEIKETLNVGKELNHFIPNCGPVQYKKKELLIEPYLLGVWLGDGSQHSGKITTPDTEIIETIKGYGYKITQYAEIEYCVLGLQAKLRALGLLKNKHIPIQYLQSNIEDRVALLQGLMDTDGCISDRGYCCFDNTTKPIMDGFLELAQSLGIKIRVGKARIGKLNGVLHKLCYRTCFVAPFPVFRIKKKKDRLYVKKQFSKPIGRFIKQVNEVPSVTVRCITVEAESGLFLAGRQFIPTHNTELIVYCLLRFAFFNPNSSCYFIAPFAKQAKELIWANRRLQKFIPEHWIEKTNNSELRITLKNGSFIKLDGSDNYEAYRGVEPHILALDEYKDHRPEFMEAMRPNLAPHQAPVIFIGTPPPLEDHKHFFFTDADEHKNDPTKFYLNRDTFANPHMDRTWLENEKARLYKRGEGYLWEREYLAQRVRGDSQKIFTMLTSDIIVPHRDLVAEVERDKRKLDWILWADPAAASVFGVLFVAINPYTRMVYAMDEIYETDQSKMTVMQIGRRIQEIKAELFVDRYKPWRQGYDEAATWFNNEMIDHFGEAFEPSQKALASKESGIALIKDILLAGRLKISDRCTNFFNELDQYRKNSKGEVPKGNDHLLDNARYILHASGYHLNESQEYKETDDPLIMGRTMKQDFPELQEDDY